MNLPPPGIIWNSLPTPALLINAADRVEEVNPAAELFLNLSAKALKGQSILERLAISAPLEEIFERVRKNRSALFVNDVDVTTGERAPVQCNLQAAPVGDDPDTVLLLISPREIADRLGRASMVKSAARSAIGMAEMLAHEIKNPLAGIAGAAQLLSMNLSGDDLELTDLIVDETRRIVKLLEQVEQFGNVRPPEKKPVNIHDVLDRARKSAAVGFGAHMTIIEDYDPSLPPTLGDADQLTQVFLNLLKNAAEAARGEGTIRLHTFYDLSLRLRRADGKGQALPLQIEVIDDGPGIPSDIASSIFEPFVSGRENGTGLGLALVSKIISDHDGWVSLDSVPGRTIFRISLPVAPKET
ncbi:ATP-binding protein [Paenirhodobacter sp. CAU 1674]|jgi:two-component system nitrogen regulation sensor histidine kinase GlnL|uniref:two-component system sensor histidine kinase NtrB n=1 Tax=Paenirhodobacter sp. CAU 1674 TaxID=3032596 RepID=UPI0023DB8597|nr:ATP-binding protein [Paenirhodobacter sp. CAU 1674]MDF2142590.1 ATP-binding protein [Paenirhodobacter sp. CAU 1674]